MWPAKRAQFPVLVVVLVPRRLLVYAVFVRLRIAGGKNAVFSRGFSSCFSCFSKASSGYLLLYRWEVCFERNVLYGKYWEQAVATVLGLAFFWFSTRVSHYFLGDFFLLGFDDAVPLDAEIYSLDIAFCVCVCVRVYQMWYLLWSILVFFFLHVE